CQVTMTAARTVTATFTRRTRTLDVEVSGSGAVTSSPDGIECPDDCIGTYADGTTVTLTATPSTNWVFDKWTDCSGNGATCTVTMSASKSVSATFVPQTRVLSVQVTGSGAGMVMSTPNGISCGSDCSQAYVHGTSVTLDYEVMAGTFAGWTGACTGTGPCVVTMDAAKSVTATFQCPTQPEPCPFL
ncbi:MAG: InlB B-repeat-containing protein, partial [Myxococcota bacterium]